MVDKWEGFSAEDIIAMKSSQHSDDILDEPLSTGGHVASLSKKTTFKQNKFGKKNNTRERMLTASLKQQDSFDILPEAALFNPTTVMIKNEKKNMHEKEDALSQVIHKVENKDKSNNLPEALVEPHIEISTKPEEPTYFFKGESLDEFEKRHKMMKEQNRMKKELLKIALEDRTKKTKEEARRLGQIEEELKKLDAQLSNDVSILRNQIEVASLDFMEAQKRYDRVEREYLDTKMELFTKREHKELLTGHLCTIIEQSELRKAHTLSDLMDKLQLGSVIIEKPMDVGVNQREAKEEVTNVEPRKEVPDH